MVEDDLKRQDGAAAAYVAAKVAGIRDPFAVRAQYGTRQRHADEIRVHVESRDSMKRTHSAMLLS
jgi:hypothetical protein